MAYRLVFAWNMSEGIPTPVLEAGAVRDMWAAAAALLEALEAPAWDFAQVQAAARAARVAFDAVTIELTPEGRPPQPPVSRTAAFIASVLSDSRTICSRVTPEGEGVGISAR
jgi:hypothetical protein